MKSDKCHLTLSSDNKNKKIELKGEVISNTQIEKLLAVHIDCKLKFYLIHTLKLWMCHSRKMNQINNLHERAFNLEFITIKTVFSGTS